MLGQPVIISLYLCRCLCNRRLQSDKLGGLREDLDGELDDVAFAPLVPRVMLDEDLEDVPDFDNLAKEARAERSEHRIVCRRNLFLKLRTNRCELRTVVFLFWNGQLNHYLLRLVGRCTLRFLVQSDILLVVRISGLVFSRLAVRSCLNVAKQLNLEGLDSFGAA